MTDVEIFNWMLDFKRCPSFARQGYAYIDYTKFAHAIISAREEEMKSEGYLKVEENACTYCDATGRVDRGYGNYTDICPVCDGTKTVLRKVTY